MAKTRQSIPPVKCLSNIMIETKLEIVGDTKAAPNNNTAIFEKKPENILFCSKDRSNIRYFNYI